jgi:AmmeMemoRadiSam system protein A
LSEESADASGAWRGPADYARACVESCVLGRPLLPPAEHGFFTRRAACFVSLKKHGELRGCIGTLEPAAADLGAEIARNARSAAFHDPRFHRVRADELSELTCSVDVLGPSAPCALADLDPAVYGVIVLAGVRRGVLLPDLQGVDTAEQQVDIARQKAGIGRGEAFTLERFTVTRYREGEPPRDDEVDEQPTPSS